jgi:NTE family protein
VTALTVSAPAGPGKVKCRADTPSVFLRAYRKVFSLLTTTSPGFRTDRAAAGPRVGLVLGAGGVVGQAYHAGVLAALEHDHGWDPRTADVIVGTSAGSITGSLLRSGVPASELSAWTVQAPLTTEGRLLEELFGTEHPDFQPFRAIDVIRRRPRLPGVGMVLHALTRPRQFRPLTAALSLLGDGDHDIFEQLAALERVDARGWPEQDLWINAVRREDGRHVLFGHPETPTVPWHRAVAASCAVPGYFAPVRIGNKTYVDGGAHSPTSADVLRELDLGLVIVISPMSGSPGLPRDFYGASRLHSARLARQEVKALRAAGTEVVAFRPGPSEQAVMGNDFMESARVQQIVQESFLAAGARAARPEVRERLSALCTS